MKITARSVYACLAVLELSRRYGHGAVKIDDIASRRGIPRKYLEQILLQLKEAGIARSRRGAEGGYVLQVPPAGITIAQVMSIMEGQAYGREEDPGGCVALGRLLEEVADAVREKLEAKSFADLLGEEEGSGQPGAEDRA